MSSSEGESDEINEDQIKDKSVDELIKAITDSKGQYAFLIGAGTSKPAGISTGSELIEKWQEEAYQFNEPESDKDDWIKKKEEEIDENQNNYGFWFEQVYTTKEQRRDHIENEVVNDAEPEFGHIVLASMMADEPGEKYVPFTLTPNFDDLLYDAFYHFIEERPMLVNHNALATEFTLTDETPTIVKVHGDYLYQNVKNLDDETRDLEADIRERIVQAIGEYGLVVIGYAGRDKSIMDPLINANRSGAGVFWCVRESEKLSGKAKRLLQQPNTFRVEIEGSEELFSKLFARIEDLQTPQADDLRERAKQRAEALSTKRDEAKKHAPEEDQEAFELSDRLEEADSYYREGEFEEAKEILEEIIEEEPEGNDISPLYARAHEQLGILFRSALNEFEAARIHFEQAIEIEPEYYTARRNLARLLENRLDKPREAIKEYEGIIEIEPEDGIIHYQLGRLHENELGQFEEARDYYERAIEIDPEQWGWHITLGALLYNRLGQIEEAREHFKQANELYETPYSHNNLGKVLKKEYNEIEAAKEHFEQAINLDSEYAKAHYNYAKLLEEELDSPEEAEEHLERAVEINPEYADDELVGEENGESI